jgi:hypothetical protein
MRKIASITAVLCALSCGVLSGNVAKAEYGTAPSQNLLVDLLEQSNAHFGSESDYLTQVNQQLRTANVKLGQIQHTVQHLQTQISQEQQRVIPILQFQYEHGPSTLLWLTLLVSARDWYTFQSGYADLAEILNYREQILHQFAQDIQREADLQNDACSSVQDLQIAKANVGAEQRMYTLAQQSVSAGGNEQTLIAALFRRVQETWDTTIAPQVENTLTQLDVAVANLPKALPQSDIKVSLTHAQVVIPQAILRQVTAANPQLRDVQFLFRQNQLILSAEIGSDMILLAGHLQVEDNQQRADYMIDKVAVDGILVSTPMSQKWFQSYGFYIDVTRLSKHLRIQSVAVENQVLRLDLNVIL